MSPACSLTTISFILSSGVSGPGIIRFRWHQSRTSCIGLGEDEAPLAMELRPEHVADVLAVLAVVELRLEIERDHDLLRRIGRRAWAGGGHGGTGRACAARKIAADGENPQ